MKYTHQKGKKDEVLVHTVITGSQIHYAHFTSDLGRVTQPRYTFSPETTKNEENIYDVMFFFQYIGHQSTDNSGH